MAETTDRRIEWLTGMVLLPVTRLQEIEPGSYRMVEVRPKRVVSDAIGRAVRGLPPEMAHVVADNLETLPHQPQIS